MEGDSCVAREPQSSRVWAVEGMIGLDAFAKASAIDDGNQRLRHDVHAGPAGAPLLPSRELFDRVLSQSRCDWQRDAETDDLLCIPAAAARLTSRFLDAACTEGVAERPGGSCEGPVLYAYASALIVEVVDFVGRAGTYSLDDQGDCILEPEPETDGDFEDTEGTEYYLVGDPADVEAARAVDVVE